MDIMALSSQLFTTDKDKRRNSAVLLAALAAALIALAQLFIVVAGKFSSKGKKNKQKTKGAKGAPSKGAKASQASQVKAGSGADGGKGSNGKLDSAGAKEAKKQEQRAAPAGVSNNGRASSSTADSSEDEDDRGTAKKSRNSRIAFVEEIPYVVPSDDSKWEVRYVPPVHCRRGGRGCCGLLNEERVALSRNHRLLGDAVSPGTMIAAVLNDVI